MTCGMAGRCVVSLTSTLALSCGAQPPAPAPAPVHVPAAPLSTPTEPGGATPAGEARVVLRGSCGKSCDGVASEALTGAVVRRARHARDCYERELRKNPKAAGKLLVTMSIADDGAPCATVVTSSTMDVSTDFEGCLIRIFEVGYPAPSGGCVQVVLPFNFVPASTLPKP